ncbi:hypothetical protein HF086_009625 [Spodoptera exigua]|uniref:HTH psq-type domain-containing protein n=1 Tax=Spodoptera exigua TaxID=7107 RepID=A0A922MT83_SPOEX|nr:hypothetical protein HF086_009625 [Spodoptera exigua]
MKNRFNTYDIMCMVTELQRKHLKNKRLEKLSQLGIDRIVDLQFGSGEAAYHVILELYDRGNIVLTDHEWTILNVLRPHVEGDKVRAKTSYAAPSADALQEILTNSKPGDNLKKVLNPKLEYGSAIIDHVLLENGLSGTMKIGKEPGKGFNMEQDLEKLHREMPHAEHETFDRAVDEFFSTLEGQKIDMKTVQVEREALKKLQNVRNDHEKRVTELCRAQDEDKKAAELISRNQPLMHFEFVANFVRLEIRKEKATDPRRWTKENMKKAIEDVESKKMGVNEASRTYEIPTRIE